MLYKRVGRKVIAKFLTKSYLILFSFRKHDDIRGAVDVDVSLVKARFHIKILHFFHVLYLTIPYDCHKN
jgi:hypothetical protein